MRPLLRLKAAPLKSALLAYRRISILHVNSAADTEDRAGGDK
jgi:hypothetical protein